MKWTRKADNLHVTLMFLGQVEPSRLAQFGEALGAALSQHPSFTVGVRGVRAFPSLKNAPYGTGRKRQSVAFCGQPAERIRPSLCQTVPVRSPVKFSRILSTLPRRGSKMAAA